MAGLLEAEEVAALGVPTTVVRALLRTIALHLEAIVAHLDPIEELAQVAYNEYQNLANQRWPHVGRGVKLTWETCSEDAREMWRAVARKVYDDFNLATIFDDK